MGKNSVKNTSCSVQDWKKLKKYLLIIVIAITVRLGLSQFFWFTTSAFMAILFFSDLLIVLLAPLLLTLKNPEKPDSTKKKILSAIKLYFLFFMAVLIPALIMYLVALLLVHTIGIS